MKVHVEYRVPVLVAVDVESGRVIAVVVDDEQVGGPVGVFGAAGEVVSPDVAAHAVALAGDATWPAWEFGL